MKKRSDPELRVERYDSIQALTAAHGSMTYPFEEAFLDLLKRENRFQQTYYHISAGDSWAFFVMYTMKLDIFTFGKRGCRMKVKVIGLPCSLSECGYRTNDEALMLRYIRTIKGAKLVLNVVDPIRDSGMTVGQTLPTIVFHNTFSSGQAYLAALRSHYRRRLELAIRRCADVVVEELRDDSVDIHALYLNTYHKSEYPLEKLEKGFFQQVEGTRLVFRRGDVPRGFVLLRQVGDKMVFMLCGMDYRFETADLYHFMLYTILERAIEAGCTTIDLGQTSEETKLKLGGQLEKRWFYAHHSNAVLDLCARWGKGLLEYHYSFKNYRVFREENV